MRKSPLKKTPEKSRSISKSRYLQTIPSFRANYTIYYCHYKNAMYMGGIKSFKKDGRGIVLHDSGVSVLTSYYNDVLHGHNIFFDNYNLLSAIYNKNKVVQAAYRIQGFLLYLTYNQDRQLQGKIKLVNFVTKTVTYATYKKGLMLDKSQQTDANLLSRVFQLGEYQILVGRTHARTLNYDFEKMDNIECQKYGNKIIIGFEKNGFINGLGFQFIFRGSQGGYNPDTHRQQDEFELRVIQRGYYMNTQLNGMGEKVFKNGNFYIGQFKNGIFQGNGILKNTNKKNWVCGFFKQGNLIELIQYNSEGSDKNVSKIVENMHQRKTNWINNEIHFTDLNVYVDQIEKIINTEPNKQSQTLEQRKMQVLRKIQEKFIADNSQSVGPDDFQGNLYQLKNTGNSSVSKFIHSFAPAQQSKVTYRDKSPSNRLSSGQEYEESSDPKRSKTSENKKYVLPSKREQISQTNSNNNISHSPGWIKVKDNVLESSRKQDNPVYQKQIESKSNTKLTPTKKIQFNESRMSRGGYNQPMSSDRLNQSSKSGLDSKRMIAKNKIFKYLQTQQQKASPQFTYTKIDTLREVERQR